MEKPKCNCWSTPEGAAARESQIDGIGSAVMHSVDMAARDLNLCADASDYIAGAVVAAVIFWAAYYQRGDSETPTHEELAATGERVVAAARDRLARGRMRDLDMAPSGSNSRH